MIATYINQNIAKSEMVEEAQRRVEAGHDDDTLIYEGQLLEAVNRAKTPNKLLKLKPNTRIAL
ncbi:hypothetical protein [Pseudoalteromonas luteoviolacea]|nr:hypothetical protein [Pseudoalteromonas luteoviolacea]